jgi:hypothetical protein
VPTPPSATLPQLRKAVGPWPWRTAMILFTSSGNISEEMTYWLALIAFADYELFPGKG